jgi:hypothetical protein
MMADDKAEKTRLQTQRTPAKMKKTAFLAGFAGGFGAQVPYLAQSQCQYTTVCGAKKPPPGQEPRRMKQTNVYFQKIQKKT